MLKLIKVLILIMFANFLWGQSVFQRIIEGSDYAGCNSVKLLDDGGLILAGTDAGDLYAVRTDHLGNVIWAKAYGGVFSEGTNGWGGMEIETISDGGFALVGHTQSFGAGGKDVFLVRMDSNGNTIWAKTYGGVLDDWGSGVQETMDGGLIISGRTASFGVGSTDAYLIRTDSSGDTLWTKTYGGSESESISRLRQTSDGGFAFGGYTTSFGIDTNFFFVKTDSTGFIDWSKVSTGRCQDFCLTSDGGYMVMDLTFRLTKLNDTGAVEWEKSYDYSGSTGSSVTELNDGGFLGVGSVDVLVNSILKSDVYVVRTDINGDTIWTKVYGDIGGEHDGGNAGIEVDSAEFLIAGWTLGLNVNTSGIYLIKTDENGISGCNEASVPTVVQDWADQSFTATFEVSSGTVVNSVSFNDTSYYSLDSALCLTACDSVTSQFSGTSMATTVSLIDSSNNASGWIWDLGNGIILDTLSTITYTYSQPGTYTICLTAYNNCDSSTSCQVIDVTTSLNQLMRQGNLSLSPIPTQESLRIQMINIKSQLIHARVLSLDGKRLVDKPVTYDESSETIFLNVEFLDPGVYILTLFAQEGFFTRRIVKL